jgi:hypothetical protein
MFESALQTALTGDTALALCLSSYGGAPAVFSESAPEDLAHDATYITYRIDKQDGGHLAVDSFTVYIDVWAYAEGRATARAAVQCIDELLDYQELTGHTRYHKIRFFRYSGGPVPESDPRGYHYNIQFTARAGRRAWCENL